MSAATDAAAQAPRARSAAGRGVGVVLVAFFTAMALAGPLTILLADEGASTRVVGMAGVRFTPATLTVPAGSEVVFDNDDLAPHTVTATDGSVDSGILQPGGSFSLVVNEPLEYVCTIHPDMTGRVELEG